jgi:hypothetical protein
VGELLETYDLTTQFQHGWALDYHIRRDDGEDVHAEVRCWDKARESAEHAGNTAALDAIADRGVAAALALAQAAESPSSRGAVVISIWFDQADAGNLCSRVIYERPDV